MLLERLRPGTVKWGVGIVGYEDGAPSGSGKVKVTFDAATDRCCDSSSSSSAGFTAAGGGCTSSEARCGRAGCAGAANAICLLPGLSAPPSAPLPAQVDVLIGADGIRSQIRSVKMGDELKYLGVMAVVGTTPHQHPLLASRGFYTVDGIHRLFTMPFVIISHALVCRLRLSLHVHCARACVGIAFVLGRALCLCMDVHCVRAWTYIVFVHACALCSCMRVHCVHACVSIVLLHSCATL
jgi:hypothetical protein